MLGSAELDCKDTCIFCIFWYCRHQAVNLVAQACKRQADIVQKRWCGTVRDQVESLLELEELEG